MENLSTKITQLANEQVALGRSPTQVLVPNDKDLLEELKGLKVRLANLNTGTMRDVVYSGGKKLEVTIHDGPLTVV